MSTPRRGAVNWFEIPVRDLDRAQAFYEAMLDAPLKREVMGPQTLAVWPYAEPGTDGALLLGSDAPTPGSGTLVYLNAGNALQPAVDRAVAVGVHLRRRAWTCPTAWALSCTCATATAIASACMRRRSIAALPGARCS